MSREDVLRRRKAAKKDAEARFPNRRMHWEAGILVFSDTRLVVDGSPCVPKAADTAAKEVRPAAWRLRYNHTEAPNRAASRF